ncbi:uncharacterized mitochondrial protein AtMg00810-like [Lactuca sativa]|uniref:uncharacterized mitochondrial protein AtMg00810-like n=1 Tax=Lactuca sativa TaxID=4236 RepID=UPI0022AF8ACE|nr:uncharacterized mitochondrial protein AtMg00810-like [Lactuca sativa]
METNFEMSSMGPINFFLGLNIRQSQEGIFINQEAYTKTLLAKFGMVGDSKVKVPMTFGTKLTPFLEKLAADMTIYRQMIGSLMYLTSSQPDIMFFVCCCARFQANPRDPHMIAVKNIFRYLKRTYSLGICYPSKSGFFVQAFSDADLGGCGLDRKTTTGGCQFLDGKLVSLQSKNQTCVSLSTVEAEYIVAASCTSQAIFLSTVHHILQQASMVVSLKTPSVQDQSAQTSLLAIKPNKNLILDLDRLKYDSFLLPIVECLKYSPLVKALTTSEIVSMSILSKAYSSSCYIKEEQRITFEVHNIKTSITNSRFHSLLGLDQSDDMVDLIPSPSPP